VPTDVVRSILNFFFFFLSENPIIKFKIFIFIMNHMFVVIDSFNQQ